MCFCVCRAYPPSSRGESEVYCERCTRWAACSHHTHMSIHRLLSHNPPETHIHKKMPNCSTAGKQNVEKLNIQDTEDEYVVEELAVLGGPSNLHHSWCNDCHLVVPNAWIHTECTTDALKGWGITSCLRRGAKWAKKDSKTFTSFTDKSSCGSGVEASVLLLQGRWFNSPGLHVEVSLGKTLNPWCAGRHLAWQLPPTVYECMNYWKSLWTKGSAKCPKIKM